MLRHGSCCENSGPEVASETGVGIEKEKTGAHPLPGEQQQPRAWNDNGWRSVGLAESLLRVLAGQMHGGHKLRCLDDAQVILLCGLVRTNTTTLNPEPAADAACAECDADVVEFL